MNDVTVYFSSQGTEDYIQFAIFYEVFKVIYFILFMNSHIHNKSVKTRHGDDIPQIKDSGYL